MKHRSYLPPFLSIAALTLVAGAFVTSTFLGCKRDDSAGVPDREPAAEQATPVTIAPVEPAAHEPEPRFVGRGVADLADESRDVGAATPHGPATVADPRSPVGGTLNRVPNAEPEPELAAAETTPVAKAVEPELDRGRNLAVVGSAACAGVDKRQPTGVSDTFDKGYVWAWIKVKNPDTTSHVNMVWKRDGAVRSRVRLDVGTSARWRTWSKVKLQRGDVGSWTVEVRAPDGKLLDTIDFDVEPEALASGDPSDT